MPKASVRLAFVKFDARNPHVYQLFRKFTYEMIATGRNRYSAYAIMNRIRWHVDIETSGSEFKISNDFIPLYARKFLRRNPKHRGFFVLKPSEYSMRPPDGNQSSAPS